MDQSDKKLKGEAEIEFNEVLNYVIRPRASKKNYDFDISNVRLEHDTLIFTLQNEALKIQGIKVKGKLAKGRQVVLALETDFFDQNDFTTKNPLYVKDDGKMIYYQMLPPAELNNIKKQFYSRVISDFTKKKSEAKSERDQLYFQNSNDEIIKLNK